MRVESSYKEAMRCRWPVYTQLPWSAQNSYRNYGYVKIADSSCESHGYHKKTSTAELKRNQIDWENLFDGYFLRSSLEDRYNLIFSPDFGNMQCDVLEDVYILFVDDGVTNAVCHRLYLHGVKYEKLRRGVVRVERTRDNAICSRSQIDHGLISMRTPLDNACDDIDEVLNSTDAQKEEPRKVPWWEVLQQALIEESLKDHPEDNEEEEERKEEIPRQKRHIPFVDKYASPKPNGLKWQEKIDWIEDTYRKIHPDMTISVVRFDKDREPLVCMNVGSKVTVF